MMAAQVRTAAFQEGHDAAIRGIRSWRIHTSLVAPTITNPTIHIPSQTTNAGDAELRAKIARADNRTAWSEGWAEAAQSLTERAS